MNKKFKILRVVSVSSCSLVSHNIVAFLSRYICGTILFMAVGVAYLQSFSHLKVFSNMTYDAAKPLHLPYYQLSIHNYSFKEFSPFNVLLIFFSFSNDAKLLIDFSCRKRSLQVFLISKF